MPTPAAAGGPVNATCALCGDTTTGALCSGCVRMPRLTAHAPGLFTITRLLLGLLPLFTVAPALPVPAAATATCWGCGGPASPNPDPRGPDLCVDCAAGRR